MPGPDFGEFDMGRKSVHEVRSALTDGTTAANLGMTATVLPRPVFHTPRSGLKLARPA